MVLVLTTDLDPHADLVIGELQRRGYGCVRVNPGRFPTEVALTLACGKIGKLGSFAVGEERVDLEDVESVWWRHPDPPATHPDTLDMYERRESTLAMGSLWGLLVDRLWVNPYASYRSSRCKPYQLQVAKLAGWDVPRTLISNRPADVVAFVDDCGGEAVYKTFEPTVRSNAGGGTAGVFTSRISRVDVESRVDGIGCSPCLFQEYITKQSELRVTVIGERIFAVEISMPGGGELPVDWRKDDSVVTFRAVTLHPNVEARVQDLVRKLGLVFGCLDLASTCDGRLVFFEINPSGQWYWVEQRTGLPMLEAFIGLIAPRCRGSKTSNRNAL